MQTKKKQAYVLNQTHTRGLFYKFIHGYVFRICQPSSELSDKGEIINIYIYICVCVGGWVWGV